MAVNIPYYDASWVGVDAYHSPGKVGSGFLTEALNCLLEGGDVVSRPGWKGLLTDAFPDPAYPLMLFRAEATDTLPSRTALIVSSGGMLYQFDPEASAVATEIKTTAGASLTHTSFSAFASQYGQFGYLVDGTLSVPIRFNLANGSNTPFLIAPTMAPVVLPTSTALASLLGTWTAETLTGSGQTNRLPNSNFSSSVSGGGSTIPTGYSVYAYDPDLYGSGHTYNPFGNPAGDWLLCDHPGEGVYTTTQMTNDAFSTDPLRNATQFYLGASLWQADPKGLGTYILSVLAYADTGGINLLGTRSVELSAPTNTSNIQYRDGIVSFASFSQPVLSYRVRITGGQYVPAGGGDNKCSFIRDVVCFPFAPALTVTQSGTMEKISQPSSLTFSGGPQAVSTPLSGLGLGTGAGGAHISYDLQSVTGMTANDFSSSSEVVLSLSKAAGITGLSLMLAFRQSGSTLRYYSNPFVISSDGLTATCDISTIPATIRSSFRYLEIVLGGDFTVPAANGTDLFLFGPLSGAGNLAISSQVEASDYSYVFTEMDGSTDVPFYVNVLESNPSPASAYLTPNLTEAEGKIVLPAPTNGSATAYALYRVGGVFDDGVGRLLGILPVSTTVPITLPVPNPYLSWNPTTRTAIDNTPDSFILQPGVSPVPGAPVFYGRDIPPAKAQAVTVSNGRLLLGAGSELYVSWLHTGIDALYFTYDQITGDPYAEVKGYTAPVGEVANGYSIVSLTSYNSSVVIDTSRDKFLLEGYNGQNYQVVDYLKGAGYGCSAPRANCLVHNRQFFQSPSGPFLFDGSGAQEFGLFIEKLLFSGAGVVETYAGCAAVYHNRRLLLSVPDTRNGDDGDGNSINDLTFVYDTRFQGQAGAGWTVWDRGFTSAVSSAGDTSGGRLYAGSAEGQIYRIAEGTEGLGADYSTPTGTAEAITMTVTTRGYGQEGGGQAFMTSDVSQQSAMLLSAPAGTQVTLTIKSDDTADFRQADPFTTSKPYEKVDFSPPAGFSGFYLTVGAIIAATGKVRVSGILLRSTPEASE